ncbi:MAG: PAS domain-containing protein [Rhodobacteraceae bacterium]|nr:PAS domain-containing protein [Paracoccaceae bacterium]
MKIDNLRGSNVISIQPIRSRVNFPAISMVEAYWEGLRNTRPMPARREVDPRGISDALEYAFILEKIAPGLARIRLAGSHINDLLGMEVRGMPLTALFLPEARTQVQNALEAAFGKPASVRLDLAGDTGMTRPKLGAQMYLAPLKDEQGAPTRILGALQSQGRIGRAPRRFCVRGVDISALMGEVGEATKRSPRNIPGFAEHATGFKPATDCPAPKKTNRKSHLRLICDNEI